MMATIYTLWCNKTKNSETEKKSGEAYLVLAEQVARRSARRQVTWAAHRPSPVAQRHRDARHHWRRRRGVDVARCQESREGSAAQRRCTLTSLDERCIINRRDGASAGSDARASPRWGLVFRVRAQTVFSQHVQAGDHQCSHRTPAHLAPDSQAHAYARQRRMAAKTGAALGAASPVCIRRLHHLLAAEMVCRVRDGLLLAGCCWTAQGGRLRALDTGC